MSAVHAIASLLKRVSGLDPAIIGMDSISHAVNRGMATCGVGTPAEYLALLDASAAELQRLIEEIVVCETWFFRDVEPYPFLVSHLGAPRGLPGDPIRILSLPCSTGEEAYSIAMALLDAGFNPRQFKIDAIDISHAALETARRAEYGRNSFRVEDIGFRDRYFQHSGEKYRLCETVTGAVNFLQGNLLSDSLLPDAGPYDAVFCRNLLIYFDGAAREKALRQLERLVAVPGLLFVGHTEVLQPWSHRFTPVKQPRVFAFTVEQSSTMTPESRRIVADRGPRHPELPAVPRLRCTVPDSLPDSESDASLERAMELANSGSLTEAAAECERQIGKYGVCAQAYFILGLIREAEGATELSESMFNKALYLEPNHYASLVHLALLLRSKGDSAGSERLYRRARRASCKPVESYVHD
jgi:chemotaxis protein methyltransferase WspC